MGYPTTWNSFGGQISGSGSLALTGGSTLYLTNTANSYTGFTNILSGALVINNMGELGLSNTTITVGGPTGLDQPQGALILQGGPTGMVINRNIDISGLGSGAAGGNGNYALLSIGNNTFNGIISTNTQDTRTAYIGGTTVFSSSSVLNIGPSGGNGFLVTGAGNLLINGLFTGGTVGQPGFYRWNVGTAVGEVTLNNPNNNFIGDINIVANTRVTSPGALGLGTDSTSVRANAGILELRVDPVYTNFGIKTLNFTGNNATVLAARSAGGSGFNQTLVFGGGTTVDGVPTQGFLPNNNLTGIVTGIDGYGINMGPGAAGTIVATGNNYGLTSNLNGLLTINGSFTFTDTTSRNYAINATGDVVITGNLLSTVVQDHTWQKTNAGTLALQGTASTEMGAFNLNNGTVVVNGMGAFNAANGGGVQIGTTTTNGILNYLGAAGTGIGESSAKAITLAGTTGGAVIFANQQQLATNTGATALTLTSSIAANGVGAKVITLGGYNNTSNVSVINTISGLIQDNTAANTTGLTKSGSGTWLYAPAASTYANATLAAPNADLVSAAAASGATTLTFNSTAGLTVGQVVSGTGIAANTYVTAVTATTVTLSAATSAAVPIGSEIGFGGVTASTTTTAAGAASTNTLALTSAANLIVGETVSGTNVPAGSIITAINGNTITINNNIATAVASGASLYFGSVGVLAPYAPATAGLSVNTSATAATASGNAVLTLPNVTGLAVGQLVTGTGVAANSYILSIAGNTVTLSQNTTGVAAGAAITIAGEFETANTTGGGAAASNSITLASTAGLVPGESVSGTNIPAGALIASISGNTVFLSTPIATTVTSGTALYFGSVAGSAALGAGAGEGFSGAVTVAGGTLQIQPTAASGNGSAPLFATPGATTTNNIVFTTDALTGNGYAGGTFQLMGTPVGVTGALTTNVGQLNLLAGAGTIVTTAVTGGGTPTLNFVNTTPIVRTAGAVADFKPGAGTAIQFNTSPTLTGGIIGGYAYFTNAATGAVDFATVSGSAPFVVQAPVYGTTGSFLNTGLPVSGASSAVNYQNSASVTTTAAESVNSLKLTGAQTITLGGALTITTGGLLFDDSTAAATITNNGNAANTIGATPITGLAATTVASNATVNLTSGTTAGFYVGMPIYGNPNIPNGATVASIVSATQFTLASTAGVAAGTSVATIAGAETIITVAGSTPGNALTLNALIGGLGAVTKAGNGTLVITGSNSFLGNLSLDEGTIQLSGPNASLGSITAPANVTAVRQGTFLDLNAAGPGGAITVGALTGAGTITNSGGVSGTAPATLNIGLFGVSTGTQTFSGLLQNGTGVLNVTKNGSGIEYLNPLNGAVSSTSANGQTLGTIGVNTYTGVTTIAQGTLAITSLANIGVNSGIGAGNATSNATNAASLVLGTNGTTGFLQYVGQNNSSFLTLIQSPSVMTNRLFTLAGNGGLDSSGGYGGSSVGAGAANNAAIWFTNTAPVAFSTGGSKTFTLQGNSTGDNEIDLQLINNTIDGSPLSVTKAGSGTWILGNTNNSYSGVTTITAGALRAQDANSNATSGTTITPTAASNILTLASSNGLSIGQTVTGAGIPAGTTITSILSPTQIQLSTTDTVATGTALTFGSINSLSPNSNLVMNGGVLETTGTFTRSLGSGAGQIQWLSGTAAGGFAASSSPLVVAIGGTASPTPLVFGTASFTTGTFLLGSATALADTTILNPFDLNGATRAITVTDNTSTSLDYYTLAGVISGRTGSGLNLNAGGSEILITAANTYSGNTTLAGNFVVSSIGSGGPSSAFGDATGGLYLGTGGGTGASLIYDGGIETTTRTIYLNTTTGTNQIDSSGQWRAHAEQHH